MLRSEKLPKNTAVRVAPGYYRRQPAWEKENGLWDGNPQGKEFEEEVVGVFRFSSPDNGPHSKIVEIDGEYYEVDKTNLEPTEIQVT